MFKIIGKIIFAIYAENFCLSKPMQMGQHMTFWYLHWWKFKISKILNFIDSDFKTCSILQNINSFKFKWSIVFR